MLEMTEHAWERQNGYNISDLFVTASQFDLDLSPSEKLQFLIEFDEEKTGFVDYDNILAYFFRNPQKSWDLSLGFKILALKILLLNLTPKQFLQSTFPGFQS